MHHLAELALAAIIAPTFAWLFFSIAVILLGAGSKCPRCETGRTRRSRSRWYDQFLPSFISPRRCESCRKRYYALVSVNYRRDSVPRQKFAPPQQQKAA